MADKEEYLEVMKFQTENLHMYVLEALMNFPLNKQLYCRGTMILYVDRSITPFCLIS